MSCKNLQLCPFYNDKMPIDSGLGIMYKRNYCEGDNTKCARYKVASLLGNKYVPDNLYPNMFEKAERIIQSNSKK